MTLITTTAELHAHLAKYSDLYFAKIEGVAFPKGPLPNLAEATFQDCDFNGSSTFGGDITSAQFVDCRMTNMTLSRAHLFGAQFIRCDLSGTRFEDCDLSAAEFIDCTIATTRFHHCDFEAAQARGCDVEIAGLIPGVAALAA
ncbi:MAG TPA: pentapeptide repeat-containing protein [Patescibacteria group bacterium]|nr:pentapeptide repeat-containing protein [Patescibacteria group bacterium]